MGHTLVSTDAVTDEKSPRELFVEAYQWMLLARVLDEKLAALYRGGKIHGGVFLGKGQEALSAAIGMALVEGDIFAPLIRDTAGRLAFGEPVLDAVRTYMGSSLGPMRGRDGNVHRGRPKSGLLPMISHLGAMISVVNGILMARRFNGIEGVVGASCIGDGATSTGAFHEAINQAAIEKLPLVLVVADNQYAYSTHTSRQFACENLVDRALGYGVCGHSVDGTDLMACMRVANEAVAEARAGKGPQLIVARLLRLCGHGEHDDASYVDPKIKQSAIGRDCLDTALQQLQKRQWARPGEAECWKQEKAREVEEAIAKVQREPAPDPLTEDWHSLASRHLCETYEDV